jgi:pimeloyl-ACP methyl ester carboxylesterase
MDRSSLFFGLAAGLAIAAAGLPVPAAAARPKAGTEGMVSLPDAQIQYFSRGKGETVVLLPGGTLTVGYLDQVAEAVAKAGYRVIGINFRGTGKSTGSGEGITLQTNADDVAGVVKALKVGPVHMVGNDFGNRVARMFAASNPELTRSVVLLAAGGKIPPAPPAMQALQTVFNPASTDAEILAAMPFFVANPSESARVWKTFKPSRAPAAGPIQAAAAQATPISAWWAPPGTVRYLILQGAGDQIAPPANGADLQATLGDRAKLVDVAGAGHLLPIEQPKETARLMVEFFRSLK